MDKKFLILGLVALAGGYYWYTTRKSTKTQEDEMPTGGVRPSDSGAGGAVALEPDVLPPSPTSMYEGKIAHNSQSGDIGWVIDGAFRPIIEWQSYYDSKTSTTTGINPLDAGVIVTISPEDFKSLPIGDDFSETSSFVNASGDFFSVQSTNWN